MAPQRDEDDEQEQPIPVEPPARRLVQQRNAMLPTAQAIQASLQSYRNVLKWEKKRDK